MKEKVKILIVEDEAIIAMRLQMELNNAGYEVCQMVASGKDAIKSVEDEKPDMVLMDIRLAGEMDGIEAAQEILSRYETSIIFMTGYTDEDVMERAKKLEPTAYLIKPVRVYDIDSIIDSALKKE